jgi:hypothetical protein
MGWAEALSPEAQLAELKLRQADACDEFVAAELELRAAVRRRNRALDAQGLALVGQTTGRTTRSAGPREPLLAVPGR